MDFLKTPKLLHYLYPGLTWKSTSFHQDSPVLYITFDDGPHPEITPWVLQTLRDYNARATFFCVGQNIEKFPDVLHETIAQGHHVGNHTYNHINGWKHPLHEYLDNIELTNTLINNGYNGEKLFRPPYGKITHKQIRHLKPFYKIIMWDILTGDFNEAFSQKKCLHKTIKHSKPGSVIIFHDSKKAEKNLKYVLPEYLYAMSEKGFCFKALF